MTDERSVADRLSSLAHENRSPLARTLSGECTEFGKMTVDGLDAFMREIAGMKATTATDALALASVAHEMATIMARNADGNDTAIAAATVFGDAMRSLKTCLSNLSGRPASDFNLLPDPPAATVQ